MPKEDSSLFFELDIEDNQTKEIIHKGVISLFEIVDSLSLQTNFYKYFTRLTEASFVNLFTQALVRSYGFNRFNILSELGVSKNENQWGRVDLTIEDFAKNTFFVLEAKSFWSSENEPKSHSWSRNETKKYYKRVFDQAQGYVKNEGSLFTGKKVLVALTFSRVEFIDDKNYKEWEYSDIESDEFYAFKVYRLKEKKAIGLAVYGGILNLDTLKPKPNKDIHYNYFDF